MRRNYLYASTPGQTVVGQLLVEVASMVAEHQRAYSLIVLKDRFVSVSSTVLSSPVRDDSRPRQII